MGALVGAALYGLPWREPWGSAATPEDRSLHFAPEGGKQPPPLRSSPEAEGEGTDSPQEV
jgi:hypothetical protein